VGVGNSDGVKSRAARSTSRPAARRARRRTAIAPTWLRLLEGAALAAAALALTVAVLGRAAGGFAGGGLWGSILPFAAVVLLLGGGLAGTLHLWGSARRWLAPRLPWAPAATTALLAVAAGWWSTQPSFQDEVGNLRALLGGRAEAERRALSHQVFAAYRRTPADTWRRLLEKGAAYEAEVRAAAEAFEVDAEVLMGVAATESAFAPRDSRDGGRGLFQITAPPAAAVGAARAALGVAALDLDEPRHNAHVAAATLHAYLAEMNGDLFLGLLAYNIGPRNGGLRSIMQQYGARDFVTIQPYLQHLPRDYPVRVLAAALAYRLWRRGGPLPRYEEGDNAARIQQIGVPGL